LNDDLTGFLGGFQLGFLNDLLLNYERLGIGFLAETFDQL
jgi:hypothetical protein